ncbi:MAG: putative DNA binding domain-containing protein, partial [Melioribacteraceae bacterium]|nr:putative DNA binding domain-containing protein [Melioribacteraceae bacterium]
KTVIAFANDAGGDIYIGVQDNPRSITGLPEDELVELEEQISNIIFTRCYPTILPDISFISTEERHLIKITVHRGSMPPYYLKDTGKSEGTYIRVGSTNRKADHAIIEELERRKRNVSFDGELVFDKPAKDLQITGFESVFLEKTGEILSAATLNKLELIKPNQGEDYPTNALLLFSDDALRNKYFHFAKVECARFKGTASDEFIDQKSITLNIALQAEEAYNFVLRHINKGAIVEGVYTKTRWEYPVKAIREVIRNAVVHRDYALTGKDIKVAVYDDMIEVTSPGLLPPSIDYSAMDSRQSDARNKIIAPVFKKLGIIDQWGNGLKLIADELKSYPGIHFKWKEIGLSFQVQFIKNSLKTDPISKYELGQDPGQAFKAKVSIEALQISKYELGQDPGQELGQDPGQELGQELGQERNEKTLFSLILEELLTKPASRTEIMKVFGMKSASGYLNRTLKKLQSMDLVGQTIPENPNHPHQKFQITKKGKTFLSLMND